MLPTFRTVLVQYSLTVRVRLHDLPFRPSVLRWLLGLAVASATVRYWLLYVANTRYLDSGNAYEKVQDKVSLDCLDYNDVKTHEVHVLVLE